MLKILKNIWLGVTLIALASALLLYSDRDRRQGVRQPADKARPRLAVMQWASTDLLDHTVAGIVEGLRRLGFENGRTADIRFFNASGDTAAGNTLARDLADGRYDMVLTASTLALQAVAKANVQGRVVHVFGGVTDPYGAGVAITGSRPDQHPPHLVGVGTFQPVERAIRLARQMNPALRKLGVVWNPGESNSEACVGKARAICLELGVELLEANAGNTSEVAEAVRSILARGAQALWVGGDTVAISSIGGIVAAARAARIPVFTNDPHDVARGVLFGVGASYRQVGIAVGEMGGRILKGTDPRTLGVENLVPEVLAINESVAAEFAPAWSISDDVRAKARASADVDAGPSGADAAQRPAPGRVYRVGVLYFSAHSVFEKAIEGIRAALRDAGFVEGRNLDLRTIHPNGDMSLLPQAARQLADEPVDVLVPLSTPCLQALMGVPRRAPTVFGVVSSPVEAGAGRSNDEHLPDVTGAIWTAPNPGLFRGLRTLVPDCRTVGVIYNPSDANSMREKETARAMLAAHGMTLVERTINTSGDIAEAAQSLLAARVDAVFGMGDNTVASGFAGLAHACRKARVPLLADDNSLMGSGALFSCGASPAIEGRRTGRLIARVLLGESTADIPFAPSEEAETAVDFEAAAALGIALPPAILETCDVFHHPPAPTGRPREIRIIRYNDAQFSADTFQGMMDGLKRQGLREGHDIRVRCLNAQGDMTTLSSIMTAVRSERPDLVMTISTPTLQAAIRQLGDLPIVFGCVADGVQAGAGASPTNHLPNVTGISTRSPVEAMASLIARSVPGVRAVGTLFSPGEVNAELNRRWFEDALAREKLTLVAVPINSSAEAAEATGVMLRSGIQVVAQIMDNSARPAYAQIARRAREAGLAFLCFDSSGLRDGATLSYGRDYHASGIEAAEVAARVLRGTPPAEIPIALTRTVTLAVNPALVRAHGIVLPPDLERMAIPFEERTP